MLDGSECRLFSDSTRQGLCLGRDSVSLLPAPNFIRNYHEVDFENQFLSSQTYYFNREELNRNGQYRIFGLSDAALSRSEFRGRADWTNTKRASVGKSATALRQGGRGLLNVDIPVKFPKVISSLVGEGGPGLTVTGNYKVLFKLDKNYTTGVNNSVGVVRQGTPSFQTLQEYNMYINGNVGSKLFVNMKTDKSANQYNQRLDLADRIQIRYKGEEDDLVQTIEAGNTTLALGGTRYAGFSQSVQGLFGVKAQGKLGGINWTTIASQQKGSSQSKSFRAGKEATTVRIADKNYLRYTYFDLGKKRIAKPDSSGGMPPFANEFDMDSTDDNVRDHIVGDPEIFMAELYNSQLQAEYPYGKCYVNPMDTTDVATNPEGEAVEGYFYKLPRDRYSLNRDSFYVIFNYALSSGDKVGMMMQVYRGATGRIDTIGYPFRTIQDTTVRYALKLLKRPEPNPRQISYYYEWKNVYDLRERNIERDGFGVKIYEGDVSTADNPSRKDFQGEAGANGVRYIELLGLDQVNNRTGFPPPDGIVDLNYNYSIVQEELGHIVFPDRYPFNPTTNFRPDSSGILKVKNPSIYNSDSASVTLSQYYLEISTKALRTEFSLGQVDILEGSEDVRLNGQKLIRDQDYRIDYQLGSIVFYNSQVKDPNADVQINYEYTPFLTSQKKNLFGLRTEYSTSERFRLGSTVLYRNASTIDQKPRIGEEPNHALLLDADFAYTGQSNLLTRLLDKLPGITAVSPSAFQLDGEIARSMPNPNTLGKAYIDDFEGSRDFTGLGIRRTTWTKSSAPESEGKDQDNRGRLAWYVPDGHIKDPRNNNRAVGRFGVLEIFPDRSVPSRTEKTDVLELRYFPKVDTLGALDTASWAGIMRWLSTGTQNHQETQLLEFWVGLEESTTAPRLHFDLGQITEDINGDGVPQTEGSPQINTISPTQDVGLDGVPDPDSSDDNWGTDIDQINGTEKNIEDPEWQSKPDKEDLNNDGGLGGADSYFSFAVDLNDTTRFMVHGSYRVNQWKDNAGQIIPRPNESRLIYWRKIQVPLKDTSVVKTVGGSPSWSNIQFVRIWLEGADTSRIIFASLDLVGNRWKELGVFDDSLVRVTDSQKVRASVINSQEDSTYRADPPPGVGEVLNKVTNLFEREQSLVLTYENIGPQNKGLLQRVLSGGVEDYSGYRTMKMLVHGDRKIGNPADNLSDSLLFFMRFGSGTQNDPNNFYEYRVYLKPGWDLNNFVNLDFNRLTNLKNLLIKSPRPSTVVQDTVDGNYRVRGNPSLASVRWYVMGVENLDSTKAASGEVWTDEMLLTDVRREAGTAGRFHLSTQLADLGSVNFEASREGATFRNLAGGENGTLSYNRTAATRELLSFSGSFQGHKFLPKFLGFSSMPIAINWSRSRSTPRLRTGSDIILTNEFAEAERSEQLRRGFSVTPSLRKETKNWLWNQTFNRMNGSFSYSYSRSSDPFTRLSEQRSYTAALAYDLSPKKVFGFKPLGWLPSLWLLKKVGRTKFSPLPATFTLSGNVSRTLSTTILNDAFGRPTVFYIRDFHGRLATGFKIFPNLSADYSFNTRRDISNPDNLDFSFSPKKFRLGLEVERRQDFRTSYNPGLFSFADTRLSFSSAYNEALVVGAGSLGGTRRIEGSSGYGANVNFNLTRLLGRPKGPSPADVARKAAERERKDLEEKARQEEKKKKEEEKKRAERWPLDSARIADSLAREAFEARRREAAAQDSIPAEIRLRESLGRFVPLPVPAFGFILPRLGPKKAAAVPATAGDTLSAPLVSLSAPIAKTGADSARSAADSARPVLAVPDSAKKPALPPAVKQEGSGEVFLLSDGINLFRKLAGRIDPVQFTYNHANSVSRQGLRNRPGLAFQFGLVTDPGEAGSSSTSNSQREADTYTAGSGLDLGSGIRMTGRYSKNIALGDISTGSSRQEAETFPDLTFNLSGLERRVGVLKKILPAGTISSNYQRQTATNFDTRTGLPLSKSTAKNHSPLVSVSATFFRGLSANFSYRKSLQETKTREGGTVFRVSQTKENGFMLSTRYSFIAPRGIRLPLLSGIRLSSSLNTNLAVQYTHRLTRDPNPAAGRSGISTDMSTLSINPSFTYSFSTQVDGGFSLTWTDQKNNIDKKTNKIRAATFSVDLKF